MVNYRRGYRMKLIKLSKKDIKKTVSNSQKIEGYKTPSKKLQKEAIKLMAVYDISVLGV